MNNLSEITKCEVCGSTDLTPVLNLGNHPLCDDLIPVGNDAKCQEYPIEILHCQNCVTSHQKYQVQKKVLFPKNYHYRSRFTADVLNGMKSLVEVCEENLGDLKDKKVLDVGCNDGSLLGFFKDKNCQTFGIEPTDACLEVSEKVDKAYQGYFDEKSAQEILKNHGKQDIITFTNVFAHIEDLNSLLDALKILIADNTILVIENHYLGAVLERNQFDTYYHEHPRTYSLNSFLFIAKKLGMNLDSVQFPSRYGGNIRVIMKKSDKESLSPELKEVLEKEKSEFMDSYKKMNEFIKVWKVEKLKEIKEAISDNKGKIVAKAFPGRAAILIKMLNLDDDLISKTYEKPGSIKIGHYIPSTKIQIVSDDEFDNPDYILNFAWHIGTEIENYLRSNGYTGKIINIL